ncbi:MAG: hemerythrin, partial [Dorea sp.]|nr:hemerythrin [Dorea sp.]
MESQLVWRDEYNIGVDVLDKEHQRLFKIINKLFAFSDEEKKSQWACQEGIKYFKDHAVKHFAEEEKYMASINYEGLSTHRLLHRGFRKNTLPALEAELEQSKYSAGAVNHFLGVCAGWLIGHTLTEDRAIVGEGASKWLNLLPEEEHEALKKVIIQLVYDMFHLESHVISETYSGEKFGKGVYYRLVYGTQDQEEQCEIFLVFEERLLINTVGKALGVETGRLDTMLISAARYTAQQFVRRIIEHLPDMEGYELKEENLLTYEQFRSVFEKKNLQVSLLIDTGEGYFSYCA